jgi:hypothetical protein
LPQVSGVQLAGTHTLLVQVKPATQVPQSSPWPQPSPTPPQNWVLPMLHAIGVHTLESAWQRFVMHCQPAWGHVSPQSSVPLQPLPIWPQYVPPIGVQDTVLVQPEPAMPPSNPSAGPVPLAAPLAVAPPLLAVEPPALPLGTTTTLDDPCLEPQLVAASIATTDPAPMANHLK